MKTEEGYQTEWDQFMYGDGDPITTKTWWGGLVSGATEVVSTIALTGGAGKLAKGASLATHLKTGRAAVEEILNDPGLVIEYQTTDLEPGDDSYSRLIQNGMNQSKNQNWKKKQISADKNSQQELIAWSQTPLKQSKDIPRRS